MEPKLVIPRGIESVVSLSTVKLHFSVIRRRVYVRTIGEEGPDAIHQGKVCIDLEVIGLIYGQSCLVCIYSVVAGLTIPELIVCHRYGCTIVGPWMKHDYVVRPLTIVFIIADLTGLLGDWTGKLL